MPLNVFYRVEGDAHICGMTIKVLSKEDCNISNSLFLSRFINMELFRTTRPTAVWSDANINRLEFAWNRMDIEFSVFIAFSWISE